MRGETSRIYDDRDGHLRYARDHRVRHTIQGKDLSTDNYKVYIHVRLGELRLKTLLRP